VLHNRNKVSPSRQTIQQVNYQQSEGQENASLTRETKQQLLSFNSSAFIPVQPTYSLSFYWLRARVPEVWTLSIALSKEGTKRKNRPNHNIYYLYL